jgi:tRNA wybutosine-synthesizing protein 4
MLKKRDVVTNTAALKSMLTNMQIPLDGDVLLRSDEYDFPIVVWIPQME